MRTGAVSHPQTVELTIYGAASLKGVLDEVKAAYETSNPGTTLTLSISSEAPATLSALTMSRSSWVRSSTAG